MLGGSFIVPHVLNLVFFLLSLANGALDYGFFFGPGLFRATKQHTLV
jgi:hypothetical protein